MVNERRKPGVLIYFDLKPCLQRLTNEQRGVLFTAILDYAESGVLPELGDGVAVGVAWDFIKPRIDRDDEAYTTRIEQARAAANKRWGASTDTDVCGGMRAHTDAYERMPTSTSKPTSTSASSTASKGGEPLAAAPLAPDKPKARRFIPPTVEEVAEYVQSRSSPVDPQGFIDYYESKGWTVGKSPMTDWKAACRAAEKWERWQTNGSATPTTQARATVKSFTEIAAELEAKLKAQAP